MELYQAIAIGVMVAMGLVVNSTVRLNSLRKKNEVPKTMLNFRDLKVFQNPHRYPIDEVKLVRSNWISCLILLVLVCALLLTVPDELVERLQQSNATSQ